MQIQVRVKISILQNFTIECFIQRTHISLTFNVFEDKNIRDKQNNNEKLVDLWNIWKKKINESFTSISNFKTIKAMFVCNCLLCFLCLMKTLYTIKQTTTTTKPPQIQNNKHTSAICPCCYILQIAIFPYLEVIMHAYDHT